MSTDERSRVTSDAEAPLVHDSIPTRREALRRMSGLLVSGSLARPALSALAAGQPGGAVPGVPGETGALHVSSPGVQLYTVRGEMQKSVEKTLERVAQIGYREVEFAGYYGRTPKQIAATLKANRLTAPSAHVDLDTLRKNWGQALDAATEIGHRYVVCPFIPEQERQAADDYRRIAGELNKAGEAAAARGITLAYHNHSFEFDPLAGTIGYDILLAESDPKLMKMELDLFWITKGGHDPLAYFAKYPGRFPLVHVKDMTTDGKMTEVGAGTIQFSKIFAKASLGGVRHYFVEQDDAKAPFASIAVSYKALRAFPTR